MMLKSAEDRITTGVVRFEPLVLHPVEVRQLELRRDELAEEVSAGTTEDTADTVIAELAHVREILSRFARGTASVSRRAGLAA
jgi:hypothetical protein